MEPHATPRPTPPLPRPLDAARHAAAPIALDIIECIQRFIGRLHAPQAPAVLSALHVLIDDLASARKAGLQPMLQSAPAPALAQLDWVVGRLIDDLIRTRIVLLRPAGEPRQVLELRASLFGVALEAIQRTRALVGPQPAALPRRSGDDFADTWPDPL